MPVPTGSARPGWSCSRPAARGSRSGPAGCRRRSTSGCRRAGPSRSRSRRARRGSRTGPGEAVPRQHRARDVARVGVGEPVPGGAFRRRPAREASSSRPWSRYAGPSARRALRSRPLGQVGVPLGRCRSAGRPSAVRASSPSGPLGQQPRGDGETGGGDGGTGQEHRGAHARRPGVGVGSGAGARCFGTYSSRRGTGGLTERRRQGEGRANGAARGAPLESYHRAGNDNTVANRTAAPAQPSWPRHTRPRGARPIRPPCTTRHTSLSRPVRP